MKINLRNLSYSFGLNILNALYPLLTLPFVFRAFNPEVYGGYVLVNVLFQLVLALSSTVLIQYFVREYGYALTDKNIDITEVCGDNIILQTCFSLAGIIIFFVITQLFSCFFSLRLDLAVWFYIPLLCSAINAEWHYYATHSYKAIFIRTLVVKTIVLAAVFIFIKGNEDVNHYAMIIAFSYAATNLISYFYIRKKFYFIIKEMKVYKRMFFQVKHFSYNSLIGCGYQYGDQILLGIFIEKSNLAILNILKQITSMLNIVPLSACRYFLPTAVNAYISKKESDYHKKHDVIYAIFVIFIAVCFIVLGLRFIEILTGDKYQFSLYDILLCTGCFLATSMAVYIDTQYSIPQKLESITTRSNLVVLLVFLLSLFPFIKFFSYHGALLSMFLSESIGVVVMIMIHKSKRRNSNV